MPDPSSVEVYTERTGGAGRIVLDRPRALNALNLAMVRFVRDTLDAWKDEPLRAITIESSSDRVFCAGGDIRQIRHGLLTHGRHLRACRRKVSTSLWT
jgi:enoyl-CoA hydratase